METTETQINPKEITLGDLPVGARLVVKCKNDWRFAVVSKADEEKITLIVCSAGGGTYRLRRLFDASIIFSGNIPILTYGCEDDWRENLVKYDARW